MGAAFHGLFLRDHPFSGANRTYHTPMDMDSRAAAIGTGPDGSADSHLTSSPADLTTGVFIEKFKRICSGATTKSTGMYDVPYSAYVPLFMHCGLLFSPQG